MSPKLESLLNEAVNAAVAYNQHLILHPTRKKAEHVRKVNMLIAKEKFSTPE